MTDNNTAFQQLTLTATNPVDFVERLIELASKGAKLKENTFPRIAACPYIVQLEIEVEIDKELQSSPGITAFPLPLSEKIITKEELEALDWEKFKKVCKSRQISGRDRAVMTTKYLQATGQAE